MEQTSFLEQLDAAARTISDLRSQYLTEFCMRQQHQATAARDTVLPIVARAFGVDAEDILRGGRQRKFVQPRQLTMWMLCKLTMLSTPVIADVLQRKDHTTVLYGRDKVEATRNSDAVYRRRTDALLKLCSEALDTSRASVA
jgi:chromosomal replication initiation ATPase DnaA